MGARAAAVEVTRTRAGGVSVQTIVNHFGGKDGLADAVADLVASQAAVTRQAPTGDVAAIVAVLFEDYERHGDANVLWTAQMDRVPAIARAAAHARVQHREWLEQVFADRLPAPGPDREHALNLYYAATDVYLWKLWRRDLGLSREDAERAMCDLLTSIDPRKSHDA